MDYWGAKGYVAPPLKLFGGPAPLAPPLPTPMSLQELAACLALMCALIEDITDIMVWLASSLIKLLRLISAVGIYENSIINSDY